MTPVMPISTVFSKISSPVQNQEWTKNPIEQTESVSTTGIDFVQKLPWLKDKTLESAMLALKDLKFDPDDIKYLKNMGVKVPYKSGADAVKFIEKQNIRILFDKTTEPGIHAQYDFGRNIITINERYRNTNDFPVILAIAEAILHEAGHAKDNDGDSSVQEELDFLGMNAIAHRAFLRKYGDIFSDSTEPIISDGVSIYAKLFFEPDPEKRNLVQRIKDKYGDLPSGDRMHPPGALARAVKRNPFQNALFT